MIAPPSTYTPSVHSWTPPHSAELPARLRPRRALGFTGRGSDLRPGDATLRTRSALVVLPDFGGFLRWERCRFVAPCSRPWGSPRFRTFGFALRDGIARISPHARPASPSREGLADRRWVPLASRSSEEARRAHVLQRTARAIPGSIPGGATPFEAFPSPAAVPRHRDRCPLAVGPSLRLTRVPHSREDVASGRVSVGSSTSGLCSAGESVAPARRCRRTAARCSHGLVHPPGSPTRAAVAIHQRARQRRSAGWSWGVNPRCAVSDQVGPGPANRDWERTSYSGLATFLGAVGANAHAR